MDCRKSFAWTKGPLVIDAQDATNDVEIKIAQPRRACVPAPCPGRLRFNNAALAFNVVPAS